MGIKWTVAECDFSSSAAGFGSLLVVGGARVGFPGGQDQTDVVA
ncbi:MAG: hypothetical protein JWN52_1909 [Actinomycetia bacterium]|nr:hypothetical protein [Actinomycetes bacterium]